tara:strand:+ start:2235 stop:3347 length:1113 start_codon:yes stop_codon:yes gene_type:complete
MGIIGTNVIGGSTPTRTSASLQDLVDGSGTYVSAADQEVFRVFFHVRAGGYVGDGSGVEVGVYNITLGTANAPLVASGTIGALTNGTWNTVDITPVTLTATDTYAVALRVLSATTVSANSAYVGSAVSRSSLDGTSAFASTWTDNGSNGDVLSMYAETRTIVASGPAITNVNTTNVVQVGDTPVVTGTSFLATGGTQTWGGVSVGVSSWADTSITSTAITRGDKAYNTNYDWIVTDNLAAASTAVSVQLAIETGYQVVTLSSPIIALVGGYRTSLCYGSVPDCVTGDQLRGPTTTDQGNTLTFNVDGTFSIAAAGNTEQTFSFEVWDANAATNDKWSASTAAVVNGVIVSVSGIVSELFSEIYSEIYSDI